MFGAGDGHPLHDNGRVCNAEEINPRRQHQKTRIMGQCMCSDGKVPPSKHARTAAPYFEHACRSGDALVLFGEASEVVAVGVAMERHFVPGARCVCVVEGGHVQSVREWARSRDTAGVAWMPLPSLRGKQGKTRSFAIAMEMCQTLRTAVDGDEDSQSQSKSPSQSSPPAQSIVDASRAYASAGVPGVFETADAERLLRVLGAGCASTRGRRGDDDGLGYPVIMLVNSL